MKRSFSRWIPAIAAPVLVAGCVVGVSVSANADVSLPDKTPSQILQFINQNPNIAFSGKVTKVANLGLPPVNLIPNISQSLVNQMKKSLPKAMSDFIPNASLQGNIATVLGLLSGTQQANVFVAGPDKARVQMLDQMSERDFVANGNDLWFYDASQQSAIHYAINPAEKSSAESQLKTAFDDNSSKLPFDITSPASVADYFLSQINPTTAVTEGKDAQIAGRGVYELTLTPNSSGSLVGSVTISVDGTTGLPLAVSVYAAGASNPAFKVAFDSISFTAPDASVFAFTPPAGTSVQELADPMSSGAMDSARQQPTDAQNSAAQAEINKLKSEGWSAIIEVPASASLTQELSVIRANPYFDNLTKAVSGGRVFTTALLNVLITDDGRVFAGSVTVDKLLEAASK